MITADEEATPARGFGMASTTRAAPDGRGPFLGMLALVFAAAVAGTVLQCVAMSATAGVPMPGGWTLSMTWLRMPGQSWLDAGASFVAMWLLMMVAMMLPGLVPVLDGHRRAVGRAGARRPAGLTALVAAGYFATWTAIGVGVYLVCATLAHVAVRWPDAARAAPAFVAGVVLLAGVLQITPWKKRQLACSREDVRCGRRLPPRADAALRHGLLVGAHCGVCCAGLMAVQVVLGIMDLRVMAVVAAVINLERLAPVGGRIARFTGAVTIAGGLALMARALGPG